jgi:predicted AlkP superfamily phosphohydrolase/phosphomutase
VASRFGPYAAADYIHSITWYDEDVTARAAAAYLDGLEMRAEIAVWLLGDRFPDWDLALIVPSELHSAAEAFWHGADPTHPLHHMPTVRASGEAMRALYISADRMAGRLRRAFPAATLVVVAMHGMGANRSDLPSMAILPELLYRHAFGISGLRGHPWRADSNGMSLVEPGVPWDQSIGQAFYWPEQLARNEAKLRGDYGRYLALQAARLRRRIVGAPPLAPVDPDENLDWMIAAHYALCWRDMPFFALPSYHDGRVRLNLQGRESRGKIALRDYGATLDRVEALVSECVDPKTGRSVVARFERPAPADPRELDDLQSDLLITWAGAPTAFAHPRLGIIGPLPYRRPGGHTGGHGAAYFAGDGIARGNGGVVSSFDVVPTILDLLEVAERPRVSGRSRAAALTKVAAPVQ